MTGNPVAPPTMPDPNAVAPRKPVWPTVLGVLSVVFGGVGVLLGVAGVVFVVFLQHRIAPAELPTNQHLALTVLSQVIYIALAGLLIVGGSLLLARRRAAVRVLVIWSVGKIGYGLLAAALQVLMQHATYDAMSQQGHAMPMATWAMVVLSVVWALAWTLAFPVFLLVWFRRPTVKLDIAELLLGPSPERDAIGPTAP